MPTRNTKVLVQILDVLRINEPKRLEQLEQHFHGSLLVVAGDIPLIARQAEELRLAITRDECAVVLDHLAPDIRIDIDQTNEAINLLFPDRFIEP